MFTVTVWAEDEADAWDVGERRARDAGYRVLVRDEVIEVDPDRRGMHRWIVRLRVALR